MSLLDVEFDRLQKLILNESIDADGGLDILPEAKNKNVRGLSPLKKRTPSHLSKRQKARKRMPAQDNELCAERKSEPVRHSDLQISKNTFPKNHSSKRVLSDKAALGMLPSSHLLGELAALILLPLQELRLAGQPPNGTAQGKSQVWP